MIVLIENIVFVATVCWIRRSIRVELNLLHDLCIEGFNFLVSFVKTLEFCYQLNILMVLLSLSFYFKENLSAKEDNHADDNWNQVDLE